MIPAANLPAPADVGQGRRRDHADEVDVHAHARGAGHDGGGEHVAGAARVLADHDGPARPGQTMRRGPAERVGEGGLEVDVGDATDSIRAEETGQGSAPKSGEADATGVGDGVGAWSRSRLSAAGLIATTLMPGGTATVMPTVWAPTSRSPTDTVPTRVDVSKALRAAVAPPSVTVTVGVERR